MKTIFILSGYSCGSSAMAGFFQRCGAHSCPPHSWTKDDKTVISYENVDLKQNLEALFSMKKETQFFEQKGSLNDFAEFFSRWIKTQTITASGVGKRFMVIKHPLTIFALEKIQPFLCKPSYIVLKRPLDDVEKSRIRRGWGPVYGREGAQTIYERIAKVTRHLNLRTFEISYNDFRFNTDTHTQMLEFCNLEIDENKKQDASNWIR